MRTKRQARLFLLLGAAVVGISAGCYFVIGPAIQRYRIASDVGEREWRMKVTAIYLNSYLDGTGRLPELLIPCLTTPISYTFEKNDPTQDKDRSNRMFGAMAAQLAYAQNGDTYILVDPGPNQIMDIREPREFLKQYNDHMRGLRDGEGICKLLYDPTNGSVSGGDLVWKSGRGCINGRQLAPQGAQDGSGTKPPSLERGDQRP